MIFFELNIRYGLGYYLSFDSLHLCWRFCCLWYFLFWQLILFSVSPSGSILILGRHHQHHSPQELTHHVEAWHQATSVRVGRRRVRVREESLAFSDGGQETWEHEDQTCGVRSSRIAREDHQGEVGRRNGVDRGNRKIHHGLQKSESGIRRIHRHMMKHLPTQIRRIFFFF